MSGYNSRGRGPSLSAFLATGNTIHSPSDGAVDDQNYDFDDELAKFTNVEEVFGTDYDGALYDGNQINFGMPLSKQEHPEKRQKIGGDAHRDDQEAGEASLLSGMLNAL